MRLPLLCVGALIINRLKAPSDLISCRIGGHRAALDWLQGQPTPLSSITVYLSLPMRCCAKA